MDNYSTTTLNQSNNAVPNRVTPKHSMSRTYRLISRLCSLLMFGLLFVLVAPILFLLCAFFLGDKIAAMSSFTLGTPEATSARLTEQAKGEHYYWFEDGSRWSSFQAMNTRRPKIRARKAAILNLAKEQPLPDNVRNELVALLKDGDGDFDSGDGIYSSRSALCYTLGYSAHHWNTYQELLDLLRNRALDPKLDQTSYIKWFDKTAHHNGEAYTGPAAIVRGLRFTPVEYHQKITLELERLLAELNSTEVSSEWARDEISKGIKQLKSDEPYFQFELDRYIQEAWWTTDPK